MSFLASIAGYVVTAVLSALGGFLLKVLHGWYTNIEQDKQAQNQAQQSVDPLKKADPNDAKAIDSATDGALGGL